MKRDPEGKKSSGGKASESETARAIKMARVLRHRHRDFSPDLILSYTSSLREVQLLTSFGCNLTRRISRRKNVVKEKEA